LAGAAFLVAVALATPFLIVLITVLLAAGMGAVFVAAVVRVPALRTTVDVLPSLDSLMPLILRAVRVAAANVVLPVVVAARPRVRDVPPADELAVEDVVALRVPVPLVARAFSTMLLSKLAVAACLTGDTGRAIADFAGEEGMAVRFSRVLEEVGERTFEGSPSPLGG
jgi:hypothetical protein